MSDLEGNGALVVDDAAVDDDDDDAVDYPDPSDVDFDEPSPTEGDDSIHKATMGGEA
jgi:hypothetical protein